MEAYAATIISTNLRNTVCSPIDTTTLAGYFIAGLKRKVAVVLTANTDIAAMHDLQMVIKASVDMEVTLDLAAKHVPSASAVFAPSSSAHGPHRNSGGRHAYAIGPYNGAIVAGVAVGGHQTLSTVPMLNLTVLQALLLAG